jgi:hypothetical protein
MACTQTALCLSLDCNPPLLDTAFTVNFWEFLLRLANKLTKYLLTFISYNSQRVLIPEHRHQGSVHMLKLYAN